MITAEHDPTADLLDEDGRPIGEIGSRRYHEVETDIAVCPYADARHGRAMNRSALRQVSQVWPDVRATVRALGACSTRPGTVAGSWQTAQLGTAIPGVLGTGRVPRRWSAVYKTSLGFSQVLTALLLVDDGVADLELAALGTGDDFLALLDRERWLVGDQQVCAGPASYIAELFEDLAAPAVEPARLPPGLDGAALGRHRATWVGMQVAYIGAARTIPGVRITPGIPCLRAVQALPGRRPEHARRLFATGDVPDVVETFLARVERDAELSLRNLTTWRDELV